MSKSLSWLNGKGGTANVPNINDAFVAYMRTKSGLTNSSVGAGLDKTLTTLGFTSGSITDRLRAFYVAKTGLPIGTDFATLEAAFYASGTNDFA